MAVFYVLPPRLALGEQLARVLRPYLPGLNVQADLCTDMMEDLQKHLPVDEASFLVHREDLPEGMELRTALRDAYGAEEGDQIVHVSIGSRPDEPRVRMMRIDNSDSSIVAKAMI